jgi:hypothetical protein
MRYLKKYENYEKYKIGDYILIQLFFVNKYKWCKKTIKGKIVRITLSALFPYKIIFDDNTCDTIQEHVIIRRLTPEEIDEYEAKIQSKKYNL